MPKQETTGSGVLAGTDLSTKMEGILSERSGICGGWRLSIPNQVSAPTANVGYVLARDGNDATPMDRKWRYIAVAFSQGGPNTQADIMRVSQRWD